MSGTAPALISAELEVMCVISSVIALHSVTPPSSAYMSLSSARKKFSVSLRQIPPRTWMMSDGNGLVSLIFSSHLNV